MSNRVELGDFLRSRRAKLSPEAAGIANGRRRRTPGLRREEVAQLAGIGVDWYVRLEQGRTVTPSATTIDALARALQLGRDEHAHLRALVRGPERPPFVRETVPPAVRRLVETLPQPAYLTGLRWDVLAWSPATTALFDFARTPEPDRNILLFMLADPRARSLFGRSWASEAKRLIAIYRTTHDLWAADPSFLALRERLHAACPELAGWWDDHEVRRVASGTKTLHHPQRGPLRFEHVSFQANDDAALKLVVYTPMTAK